MKDDQKDQNSINQSQEHRGIPRSKSAIIPELDAAYTPTLRPWRLSGFDIQTDSSVRTIVGADDFSIAWVAERSPEENKTNAELIVRAVNAYDALVTALEAIRDSPHCSYDSHSTNHDDYSLSYATGVTDGHRCAAQTARATLDALALALIQDTDTLASSGKSSPSR